MQDLFPGEGHLYVLGTIDSLELILGESMFHFTPIKKKKRAILGDLTSTSCLLLVK